jgi:hypothetical protein
MSRINRDSAERARLVAACRASGLSVREFAAREGVALTTLYQWLAGPPKAVAPLRLARVIRRPVPIDEVKTGVGGQGVVVELGGARVRVEPGFARGTLAAVLDVLDVLAARRAPSAP